MSDPTDKDAARAAAGDAAAEEKSATAEKPAAAAESAPGQESGSAEKSAAPGDSAAADKPAATGDSAAADKPAAAEKPTAAESTTAETPRAVASPTAGAAPGGDATRAKTTTAEAEGESSTTADRSARTLIALAATAALLIAAIAASITLFIQNSNHTALEDARKEAQQAACTYAPVLAEYDAKNLDAYFQGVLDGATGDWKQQFADTSKELRDVLSQGEVISKADDVQCAIKSADETSAEAIVVIGQTITSLGTQGKPAPGQLSMVMRLQKIDDRWLVNNVNSPLAPNQP
ncbi:hypothetical protein [Nocardia harenae]|uniref:hypothetical protein n=1 Tax=Nocardia harenae TaxID=358707 RepID=UPI000A03673E|nr:hypothetical protein [Nocardia harenae]